VFVANQNNLIKDAEKSLINLQDCLQTLKVTREMIPELNDVLSEDRNANEGGEGEERRGLISGQESNLSKIVGVVE